MGPPGYGLRCAPNPEPLRSPLEGVRHHRERMPANACVIARSTPRHRHLLRELREHPIQTMSLLRAAPLPTPLKIYGLSLFPAELIPLTSYAGIAITFNLLRAQHGQNAPRAGPSYGSRRSLRLRTARRPSGPPGSRAELRPLGPHSAALRPL